MIKSLEKTFKALADRSRLRIINMLQEKSLCVCEITEVLGLSQSTASGHLRILKEAELVEDTKDGLWVEYRLKPATTMNRQVLGMIKKMLMDDQVMLGERKRARKADREVLCRK